MSVQTVVINPLSPNDQNDLIQDIDLISYDEDTDYEEENSNENDVLLRTTNNDYIISHHNLDSLSSTTSSITSSTNSLINNQVYLDAREFEFDAKSVKMYDFVATSPAKNENITIKKVESYAELSSSLAKRTTNANTNSKYVKKYYDTGYMGAYSSKKLLNSMSRSLSKSQLSKASSNCYLSSSIGHTSITPLSSTSFSSLFVNTTFFTHGDDDDGESISKVKKMKISEFQSPPSSHPTEAVITDLKQQQSRFKSLHLKLLNRKIIKKKSSLQVNHKIINMNPNAAAVAGGIPSYASKFLKLKGNELNFKIKNKQQQQQNKMKLNNNKSLSNLSNFSLANSVSMMPLPGKKLKCLLVGDQRVGKTALMCLFLRRMFQFEYQPTIVDDYEVKMNNKGESYALKLFDTAGQEDWDTLRKTVYPDTDVIILCFSVAKRESFENITSKWIPELNKLIPSAQIVLVGTQIDLRANLNSHPNDMTITTPITWCEGEELKQRIKAYKYIECSARTQTNVTEVFNTCIDSYIQFNKEKVDKYKQKTSSTPCSCFQSLFKQKFRFTDWLRRFNLRRRSSKTSKYSSSNKEGHLHES